MEGVDDAFGDVGAVAGVPVAVGPVAVAAPVGVTGVDAPVAGALGAAEPDGVGVGVEIAVPVVPVVAAPAAPSAAAAGPAGSQAIVIRRVSPAMTVDGLR